VEHDDYARYHTEHVIDEPDDSTRYRLSPAQLYDVHADATATTAISDADDVHEHAEEYVNKICFYESYE
jgi:hypothetical protein